ncbi:MAG TPA: HIT family protein [Actinomycetota bacterium]|nr:HIT family protein [Actinomycetota bacterium]
MVADELWRACHAFNTSLPGWVVVLPRRHIEAIHELTDEEAAGLGPLIRSLSIALRTLTGCRKTYVVQFAEAEGFAHVHFHVVPRMDDFAEEQRGPNVFSMLGVPEEEQVPEAERDRIALAIRAELGKP